MRDFLFNLAMVVAPIMAILLIVDFILCMLRDMIMIEVWVFVFGMMVGITLWNVAIISYREIYSKKQ